MVTIKVDTMSLSDEILQFGVERCFGARQSLSSAHAHQVAAGLNRAGTPRRKGEEP
jgi:hypothetical protein